MTEIALCTRGRSPVTITSIEPVTVTGQMHVDQLLVRRGARDEWADYSGVPPGSRPAAGFTIPAPTMPCNLPGTWIPRYQAAVVAHLTGARYGSMIGLRVRYRVGNAQGVYTIPVTFFLCGKGAPVGKC